jgi:hypothetical protein
MPSAQEEALMLVDRDGRIARSRGCRLGECPGVTIGRADRPVVAKLIPRLREGDLLIAIERPPPLGRRLAIGVAGDGYLGTLESSATRIDGYALSTDLAPTVLERYGLAVPAAMTGTPIGSIGVRDLDALSALSERLGEVSPRRGPRGRRRESSPGCWRVRCSMRGCR